jgi:hypothetical protein
MMEASFFCVISTAERVNEDKASRYLQSHIFKLVHSFSLFFQLLSFTHTSRSLSAVPLIILKLPVPLWCLIPHAVFTSLLHFSIAILKNFAFMHYLYVIMYCNLYCFWPLSISQQCNNNCNLITLLYWPPLQSHLCSQFHSINIEIHSFLSVLYH